MLESLFGIGKSKKSRHQTSNGSNGGNGDDSPNDENSYVFVGNNDPNKPPYPQTIMLNDELIRMGSSSSINPQPSNSMYPSLDPNASHYPNPKFPYSSDGGKSSTNQCRNCSPIDNVPFSINNGNGNGSSLDGDDADDIEITNILNRVENFLNNTCQYEFTLENSILRESL